MKTLSRVAQTPNLNGQLLQLFLPEVPFISASVFSPLLIVKKAPEKKTQPNPQIGVNAVAWWSWSTVFP